MEAVIEMNGFHIDEAREKMVTVLAVDASFCSDIQIVSIEFLALAFNPGGNFAIFSSAGMVLVRILRMSARIWAVK